MDSHEALTVPIKEDPGIVLKFQLPNPVKLEDEEIPLDITGDYIRCVGQCKQDISNYLDYSCPIIPCHLLVRRGIPSRTFPSRYLVRTFDTIFLSRKISEKRLSPEEYGERLRKCLHLV